MNMESTSEQLYYTLDSTQLKLETDKCVYFVCVDLICWLKWNTKPR